MGSFKIWTPKEGVFKNFDPKKESLWNFSRIFPPILQGGGVHLNCEHSLRLWLYPFQNYKKIKKHPSFVVRTIFLGWKFMTITRMLSYIPWCSWIYWKLWKFASFRETYVKKSFSRPPYIAFLRTPLAKNAFSRPPYTKNGICKTPIYNKMAFSRPLFKENGIFETPYTKNGIFETPKKQNGIFETLYTAIWTALSQEKEEEEEEGEHKWSILE